MNRSSSLLVSLTFVLAGCATTGAAVQDGVPSSLSETVVFVESLDEGDSAALAGAFLPAECLDVWSQAQEVASGEIALAGRGIRRGPGSGVRRAPLLSARPPVTPLQYWRHRPPDPRVVEQARQLYRQRLAEAQGRYPNSRGYQEHHAIPIYLGGNAKELTYRLPTAYHQAITQEFRREWPYGQEPPRPQQLAEIMIRVYAKYPLPQLIGIEP